MYKMNCIVVDDEPLVLNLVKKYANQVPFLNLISTFESAFDALELIQTQQIDLLLLDINMPDINGIQFLKSLHKPPMIIFTTAYAKYALEGYELDAVDYLLKPYGFERFLKAINKAFERKQMRLHQENKTKPSSSQATTSESPTEPSQGEYIFVKSDYSLVKIALSQITHIQGFRDYIKIYLEGEINPILSLQTLRAISQKLPKSAFMRVHRSYIVKVGKISQVRGSKVFLDKIEIPIGDYYREDFYNQVVDKFL